MTQEIYAVSLAHVVIRAPMFEAWYQGLLREIQDERIDPRRNRIKPRVIKKPQSNGKKKRPKHRRLPPLKKTLKEAVVMIR